MTMRESWWKVGVWAFYLIGISGLLILLGGFFFGVAFLGGRVLPFYSVAVVLWAVLVLPSSLFLALFRSSREVSGRLLFYSSYFIGLHLWLVAVVAAFSISAGWGIFGLLLAAVGIVPVAAILCAAHSQWAVVGLLAGEAVVLYFLRHGGMLLWMAEERRQEREFERSLAVHELIRGAELHLPEEPVEEFIHSLREDAP